MESLNIEGLFWLAKKPDYKVAGRLNFDIVKGGVLDLIGSFQSQRSPGKTALQDLLGDDDPVRIHGVAGRKLLTLYDCLRSNVTINAPGITQEQYQASAILSGGHFDENVPLEFEAAKVRLRFLEHWIGKSGVQVHIQTEEAKGVQLTGITYSAPETMIVNTSFGQLELSYNCRLRGRRPTETIIDERCTLRLTFSTCLSMDETVRICSALQNLVTIGLHAPSTIAELSLSPSDQLTAHSPSRKEWIKLYAQFMDSDIQLDTRPPHPAKMLFTFEDIGGLEGVAKWVKIADKYATVTGTLVNHWYVPNMYLENQFFNAFTSAEALRRIQLGSQNINMSKELNALAGQAGPAFLALVGDLDSWTKRVIQVRQNRVVHRGLQESSEGLTLYLLAETLYFLVVLCLLQECDVPARTMTKIQEHQRFSMLAKDIRTLD